MQSNMRKPGVILIAFVFLTISADKQLGTNLWHPVAGLLECLQSSQPYVIADPTQCDKYYVCENGKKQEVLCPDGMAFQFSIQSCVYLVHATECEGTLQTPKPNGRCLRQYGFFPTQDPPICNKFLHCIEGTGTEITCPDVLLYNPQKGACDYPNNVDTSYCVFSVSGS